MAVDSEPRKELAMFLRARREAVAGKDKPGARRRRTPGLRREEVAERAGVSVTWYTWAEQGRDIALSSRALARLADALEMNVAERAYMFELARARDPSAPQRDEEAPFGLQAAVSAFSAPAYCLDRRWNAIAWNDEAARLFSAWLAGPERSLLRFVFFNPAARDLIEDWETRARRLVAEYRADTARAPNDGMINSDIEALTRESPTFAGFWKDHGVLARDGGERRFHHPELGALTFEQMTLTPSSAPGAKLVLLLPASR